VRLVDFGLARIAGRSKLTKTGSTLGTVGYMSPEQVHGEKVDERSDIFSFGVVLYELVTGKAPFTGDSEGAILHSITHDHPEPLARYKTDVPAGLQRVVDKALEKDRETRYQHVDDLLADLMRVKREMDSGRPDVLGDAPSARRQRRYAWVMGAVATVVVAALVLSLNPSSRRTVSKWFGYDPIPARKHLAVLPFANLGDVLPSQAFCDGLMETMTSKLTQLEQFQDALWVVPVSEVREREVNSPGEARRQLGVTLVVTGSVQRLDDKVRMTLNLVDAKTQRQLRSTVIDDSAANVSALQDSMVFELAKMLEVQLLPEQHSLMAAGGTAVREAYDLYLEGRGHLQQGWEEWGSETQSVDSSIILFHRAIEIDSSYALAFAALGEACWRKYDFTKESRWVEQAMSYSRQAIELNDRLPSAHVSLGLAYRGTGQYEKAKQEFSRALDLNPVNHDARRGLATAYEALGDFEQAESTYQQAIARKPDYWYGYIDLSYFYLSQGRKEDALKQLNVLTALEPGGVAVWNDIGALYNEIGALYFYLEQRTNAREAWERSLEIKPNYPAYSNLGALFQTEMDYPTAASMYEKALTLDDRDYQVWMNLASLYHQTPGKEQKAKATYQKAIQLAEAQRAVNPRLPDLLSDLADCYAMTDDSTQALLLAEQALSLAPENILILARIGIVFEVLGKRDQALDCIGKALAGGFPLADIEQFPELEQLRADSRFVALSGDATDGTHGVPDSIK